MSLFNFSRLRRRRHRIISEARRLGLIVPGMEGYIPMRDRQGFVKSDGWKVPQFWEITRSEKGGKGERSERVGPAGPTMSGEGRVSGGAAVEAVGGVIPPGPGGIAGSTTKADVKGEEEWVEKADGREADRIAQMVDIGQRATLPAPSEPTMATTSAVAESQPAPPTDEQTYGARDLLEMPPLDQIVSNVFDQVCDPMSVLFLAERARLPLLILSLGGSQ